MKERKNLAWDNSIEDNFSHSQFLKLLLVKCWEKYKLANITVNKSLWPFMFSSLHIFFIVMNHLGAYSWNNDYTNMYMLLLSRICFVVTMFFALMALLMVGVKTSRDPRAGLQNGCWGIKYVVIVVGCISAFFIPHGAFGPTWMYFGLVGGMLFIIIQAQHICYNTLLSYWNGRNLQQFNQHLNAKNISMCQAWHIYCQIVLE